MFDDMIKVETYYLDCKHCLIGHGKIVADSKQKVKELYEKHLYHDHRGEWEYYASRAILGSL